MARKPPAPIVFNEYRALWLTDFLLSQPADLPPFDWSDPAFLLLDLLQESGWDTTNNPRTRAALLTMQSLLDAGVDSYVLTAAIGEHLLQSPQLIDPDFYLADWNRANDEANYFVSSQLGHFYRSSLADQLPRAFYNIGAHLGSDILNIARPNGHPISAQNAVRALLSTVDDWTGSHRLGLETKVKSSLIPGCGPKKSALLCLRLVADGLLDFPDIHTVGIPTDVHAVVLSFCTQIMSFDEPVGRDRAVRHLRDFWTDLCCKHHLDNLELYRRIWLWGRRMCRPINCAICPIRCLVPTTGRLATSGYYSKKSTRWLDPKLIASEDEQLRLSMGEDFLKIYAPELIVPGVRVTNGVAGLIKRTIGMDLQLSLDVEAVPAPNPAEYDPNEDPFEE